MKYVIKCIDFENNTYYHSIKNFKVSKILMQHTLSRPVQLASHGLKQTYHESSWGIWKPEYGPNVSAHPKKKKDILC